MLKYYLPHIIFFAVFCAALLPVLFYYRRRNPNPRFRPGLGEMAMVSLIALTIGGGFSYMMGNFFAGDPTLRDLEKKPDHGVGAGSGQSLRDRDKEREDRENRGRRAD